ncbi:TIGR02301 family protein [Nitratireductor sp. XY-223]|uniref:TIGR02301 family protein n=1 Tax=Nitratireductor sp. XY-223 TaxID=2561926 RepID=UPI0010AAD660|nr:TIGR02301 family protein [Nitratireductor sp. XY-223]
MKRLCNAAAPAALTLFLAVGPVAAQTVEPPYEERLIRLSEIVGSVHYLRKLCLGSDEGWRAKMQSLIDIEATDPDRRARFVAAFNKGYRSFASVHRKCNSVAVEAEELYRKQGLELASEIIARYGN